MIVSRNETKESETLNPIFQLKNISENKRKANVIAFMPTIDNNYEQIISHILDMEKEGLEKKAINSSLEYVDFIEKGNIKSAVKALSGFYKYKSILIKTVLETALITIGNASQSSVNSIFNEMEEDISPISIQILTRFMIGCPKSDGFKNFLLTDQARNILDDMDSDIPEIPSRFGKYYDKLKYCSKEMWLYPSYILKTAKNNVISKLEELPRKTEIDQSRAMDMEI
jgi:hypothetical protein